MSGTIRKTLMAGGFVVAVVAAATGIEIVRSAEATVEPAETMAVASQPAPAAAIQSQGHDVARELSQAFRTAAGRAAPAVVLIQVQGRQQLAGNLFFEFPFGERREAPEQRVVGSGSGFIFRPDGYIMTNNHVVESADQVTVQMPDGREFDAVITGRDPVTDVAVLKIEATDLPTVELGNSDEMEVGDWVVALGYPLNLGSTATAGIVSAKGRGIQILDRSNPDAPPLEQFIQTDAAINRGNSGGPLIDLHGRVIGVNSAIASQTGFYTGYGFAVPVNIARRVADDLVRFGEFRRPRLGVEVGRLTQADAEAYGLESLEGAHVVSVTEGGAAEKAGLRMGDVVVGLDGERISDGGQLTEMLAQRRPGDRVNLDVVRGGQSLEFTIELGAFESGARVARADPDRSDRDASVLGFKAVDLNERIARQLQLESTDGVVITEVDRFGPASGRLAARLVVVKVNDKDIRSLADLEKAASSISPGDVVSIVYRMPDDGRLRITNYRLRN